MKSFRLTTLLFALAVLLIASVGVSAQTSDETAEPAATDEMMMTEEAAATDEMAATEEMMATEEMIATEEAAMSDPFYTGNGSAELASVTDLLDPAAGSGFVRFAHVSPDTGPLDIYMDDLSTPLVNNLQIGEYTGAVRLPSGAHSFLARAAGSPSDSEALTQFDWDLGSNSTWIIMAVGTQNEATFLLEPLNVLRNFNEEIARIRVLNADPYINGLTVNVEGGESLAEGLNWLGTSDLDTAAGELNMTVVDEEGNPVSEPVNVTLEPYFHYSIVLASTGEESVVTPIVIASPRDTSRVRFVSERQDTVEVLLMPAESMLIEELSAGDQTDFITLPSEAATFALYAPGTGPTGRNLAGVPVQLEPGYDFTVTFGADGTAEVTEKVFTDPMAATE